MGGAMNPLRRTPAEWTALRVERAAHSGSPLLIPGAWDTRDVSRAVRATTVSADPHSTGAAPASIVSGRERLERELEGGGAPCERPRGHQANFLTRLWRTTLRPTEIG